MSNKVNKVKSTYLPVKEAEQKSDSKPDEKRKDFQKSTYLSCKYYSYSTPSTSYSILSKHKTISLKFIKLTIINVNLIFCIFPADLTKRNSENPTKSAFVDQNDNKTIKPDVTQRLEISNYQSK